MLDLFSNRKIRQKEIVDAGRMVNESIGHVNEINMLLDLEPMQHQEGGDVSLTLARINNQLSHIAGVLMLGQYSPQGELRKKMQYMKDERDSLQSRLQNHINEVNGQVEILSEEAKRLKEEKDAMNDTISNLNRQLDMQKINCDSLKEQLQDAIHNEQEVRQGCLNTINHIISFRDQLFSQLGYAKAGHDEKGICIIEGIIMILGEVFRESGVVILDNSGEYDSKSQYITGTAQTDNSDLDMQIKETTKEGYLFEGKLIRQQEVVVDRYEKVQRSI